VPRWCARAAALIETHDLDTAGGAHSRAVATLARIAPDPEAIAAALLLPALEDRRLDVTTIEKCVGAETARLVASAARIAVLKDYRPLGHERGATRRLRDMLLAIVEDPRGLLIRLADQLVRLRTASTLDTATRRRRGHARGVRTARGPARCVAAHVAARRRLLRLRALHFYPDRLKGDDIMARSVVDFFGKASKLDEHDRATLAGLLLESIEQEPDPDVEEAWKREIARRIEEIDSGSVSLVPWEEVKAKLFRAGSDES